MKSSFSCLILTTKRTLYIYNAKENTLILPKILTAIHLYLSPLPVQMAIIGQNFSPCSIHGRRNLARLWTLLRSTYCNSGQCLTDLQACKLPSNLTEVCPVIAVALYQKLEPRP